MARLMDYAEASRATGGLSKASMWRRIKAGEFPRPVVMSLRSNGKPARVAFVESEILEYCDRLIARARRGDGAPD